MNWKTDPIQLAKKMLAFIEAEEGDVTYTQIQDRASKNGIDLDTLDIALTKLHNHKKVDQRVKGGDIVYRSIVPKKKVFQSHLTWLRENYPAMDDSNKCEHPAFINCNFDYLFLTPKDLEKYKAEVKGRVYMPKKTVYRKKKEVV